MHFVYPYKKYYDFLLFSLETDSKLCLLHNHHNQYTIIWQKSGTEETPIYLFIMIKESHL